MTALRFEVTHRGSVGHARTGVVTTPHGSFRTPAFMPVGTRGTVKGIVPEQVADTGAEILLNNTYHLLLRPGDELVREMGGVHRFMGWDRPILTDSGGYQAYSMADTNAVDDDGVTFASVVDGSTIRLTPERAVEIQNNLGADIIMALDDCPPSVDPATTNQTRIRLAAMRDTRRGQYDHDTRLDESLDRTARWLERCKAAHARGGDQALFGIVQGGTDLTRRDRSVQQVCGVELPGYAVGGVAVGEGPEQIATVVRHTAPQLPEDKPRYLMGVGYERDIVSAVLSGIDMFDCVLPTRNGRSSNAFTRTGQVRLKNSRFKLDPGPIEPGCDCVACNPAAHGVRTPEGGPFSRAYLRHLFLAEEMLGGILVSLHNLRHFQRLMEDIRGAIVTGDWAGLAEDWPVVRGTVPAGAVAGLDGGLIGSAGETGSSVGLGSESG